MPRKVFVAGEILTADDVNTNLMDQAVQRFADSGARGSAIPSPTEGMTSYLDDLNRIEVYNGTGWGAVGTILQVVSVVKTDVFTTTSGTFTPVTGLSVSITPSSTSSKILVMSQTAVGGVTNTRMGQFKITRGGTDVYIGDADGSRIRAVFGGFMTATINAITFSFPINFVDSPATTSTITYQLETRRNAAGTVFVNRNAEDINDADGTRGASSIILMEVAG